MAWSAARLRIGIVAAFFGALVSSIQADDKTRENEMRNTRLWQKQPLDRKDLDRCLIDCRSGKIDVVKEAMFQLALAYPDPKRTRDVINAAKPVLSRFPDKFFKTAYGAICSEWEGAEKAAQVLAEAKRKGGLKHVEQLLQSQNGLIRMGAREALRFSGDVRAGEVLVRNHDVDRLAIRTTLLDVGPSAANAVTELLKSSEWQVRNDALSILKELGTRQELDAIRSVERSDSSKLVQDNAKRTIAAIEAREKR